MLKKIGEEATETVLAAKSGDRLHLVRETADLWFHCMILLARHGLGPGRRAGRTAPARRHLGAGRKGGAQEEMNDPRITADCIFCKIVRGEIPSKKLYEDEDVLAFHDVRPQAPVHFLIIPKEHVATLYDAGMAQHRALRQDAGARRRTRPQGRARRTASAPSSTPGGWGIRRCIMSTCT